MKIIKRNGSEVDFSKSNIIDAISKANQKVKIEERLSNNEIKEIAKQIEDSCKKATVTINVEDIQDMVEEAIYSFKESKIHLFKEYHDYRTKRTQERQKNTTDDYLLSLLSGDNEEVQQENANKNPTIVSTQRDYMAGIVSKDLAKRYLIPQDIWDAHKAGIIHFHDADYFANPIYNCFSANTKFITGDGIRKFSDYKDGDIVTVKDKDGILRQATVRNYGKQVMNIVTLNLCGKKETICVTDNHRWILKDGTVTTNLKVGDVLYQTKDSRILPLTDRDIEMFCIGFVLGDGCDLKNNATHVKLCGNKIKYKDLFKKAGWSEQAENVMYKHLAIKQNFLNGKTWRFLSNSDKINLFNGYYAADGAVNSNRLATSDERLCTFIEECSSLAGYYISSKTEIIHDTNYKENAKLINYHFIIQNPINKCWTVEFIEKGRRGEDDVWCVEEPITHTFTLDKGIVTGNCCLINLDDMLQNGTVISGTTIDKPHTFSTACNIASQVVAQVASSQYGGQTITASHLSKFVKETRNYYTKKYKENFKNFSEEQINEMVEYQVKNDVMNGVQTLQYQILTLMTTNGQTPFVSICLYLNEAENEEEKANLALVIEEILKQRIQGVKNENGNYYANPFPKLLYVLEEDNVTEDSKYWYLTELAAECNVKRMVPDYISEKVMKELKKDKKGNGNCYPCMGCVSGDSKVKIRVNNEIKILTIEEMWNNYAKNIKHQFTEDNPNLYSELENIEIFDNKVGFTKCKMINKNVNNNWILLKLKSENEICEITCTDNHIWTTTNNLDKTTTELSLQDKILYSINEKETIEMNIDTIISFNNNKPSFDVTTESEHFEVNGLYSHNCRSFLTPYILPKHKETIIYNDDVDLEVL